MGQSIFASGIKDVDGSLADDGGNVLVIDGVNHVPLAANSNLAKGGGFFGLYDPVDVLAALARLDIGSLRGNVNFYVQILFTRFFRSACALCFGCHGFSWFRRIA